MKKMTLIGIIVATAMGFFVSCQKEMSSNDKRAQKLIKETFSASIDRTDTKTTISDDGLTVNWTAEDTVFYYTSDAEDVRKFAIESAGSSATLALERGLDDTYYNLVYIGSTAPTFTTKESASMVFDGVKAVQDGTFANANVSVAHTIPGGSSITFKPVTALVKFTTSRTDIKTIVLTGGAGTEKVAGDISVDPTATNPIATLNGDGSTNIIATIETPHAGTYYINVLPYTYSNGLTLIFSDASNVAIGAVYASNSIDLSAGGKMINLGNIDTHVTFSDLGDTATANCYIVSAPGAYKFKTVQGNSNTSVGTVSNVEALWESFGTDTAPATTDLVKNISLDSDYVHFISYCKKGNALIAAKDVSSNILWSWHIWLTDAPADQVYNNSAGTMMDRNLGATSAEKGDLGALGLLYQWGRKDPFLGSSSISSADVKALSTGSWKTVSAATARGSNTNALAYSILNPTTFITSGSEPFNWYCTVQANQNDQLWKNTSAPYKTVYDPCPPGYRVPEGGGSGFWKTAGFPSSNAFDSTNLGMDFAAYTTSAVCWFPSAGLIGSTGSLAWTGNFGSYWTCSTTGGRYAFFMKFTNSGSVLPAEDYDRAMARSVRCMKE